MARGLGRALEQAVARDGPDEDLEIEGRSLANARRRQMFRYLCRKPCARVGEIGRELAMSQATVRWHAWDLVENGYVQIEGTRAFPKGLIDPEDAAMFASLASSGRAAILEAVFRQPGLSFQELAAALSLTRQSVSKMASRPSSCGGTRRRSSCGSAAVPRRSSSTSRSTRTPRRGKVPERHVLTDRIDPVIGTI